MDVKETVNSGINLTEITGQGLDRIISYAVGQRQYKPPTPASDINQNIFDKFIVMHVYFIKNVLERYGFKSLVKQNQNKTLNEDNTFFF